MNKQTFCLFALLIGFVLPGSYAQNAYTLDEIITRSKAQSPVAKQADTRLETSYWQYRVYRTSFNPQLSLDGSLPNYYKKVSQIIQEDGTYRYIPVEQTNNSLSMGLFQPLPWTGGTLSANTSLGYFKDYHLNALSEQWTGNVFNISLDQPIFSFNQMRWDRKTEPLRYEESRREYVEQMELVASQAVEMFFNVLQSQIGVQIARFNLANNDTIYKIEQGRYNIGTTSQDKLLQVELQLLRSRQDVAQASLDLETARLELRSYMGLRESESYDLLLPEMIPQFEVSVEDALNYARKNRSAFIAFERRRLEAERDVAQARGQRFQTKLSATYGLNNNGIVLNDIYTRPEQMQQFNLTLNVPILDWGRNKARMRTALANKKLSDYVISQDEVDFEQTVITQVRKFEMLRLQIEITHKSDDVAAQRYNVAQNRYLIGKIDITNLNIALTEKDDAKRSYLQALKSFWVAYYDLRRLTLYDFYRKELLFKEEGQTP
ncbi:TolC family protein [Parachryseolinea silvisoli]|uniref:TolC family protein n=1 Tax=Parachryseolinea silvisoli TaxID=2873601 RepID=UPI002265C945|nr:TolC family protein [Parachryseolinea silvisoli]MCD9017398.1 TolC family protein [Parachryseolinea silvisoli]